MKKKMEEQEVLPLPSGPATRTDLQLHPKIFTNTHIHKHMKPKANTHPQMTETLFLFIKIKPPLHNRVIKSRGTHRKVKMVLF